MGTRGYIVYRYRKIYIAFYHHYDSYPSNLGIKVLLSMRKPDAIAILKQRLAETQEELSDILYPEESFEAGLDPRIKYLDGVMVLLQPDAITLLKRRLVEALDEFNDVVYPTFKTCNDTISWTRPTMNTYDATWIYEIDLDRNIFHINEIPYFRLDCLPNEDGFLSYTDSEDHYGNDACDCPPRHKYERPAPPNVTDSELAMYRSLVCAGSHVTSSELLATSDILSPIEQVRVSLLETIVGQCMEDDVASIIRQIDLVPNHNQLTDDEWSFACSMANVAFIPQIFDKQENINNPHRKRAEFIWVREDTVLYVAVHLEDERCLQASMSRLINAISEQKNTPGDYFGVAFSVYHCAIIKVVKGKHATTFSHTDTLQFLPSFFGNSPSTPGIVAIARLAYRVDPALFVRTLQIWNRRKPALHTKWSTYNKASLTLEAKDTTRSPVLPAEIWLEIAPHLHVHDILALGLVSRVCRQAASMILRHPHICGFRLVAIPKERAHCPLLRHGFLTTAMFSAVEASVPASMVFGDDWIRVQGEECVESRVLYIPLRVASKDPYDRLKLSIPLFAERMAFVDEKCLCGEQKHHIIY